MDFPLDSDFNVDSQLAPRYLSIFNNFLESTGLPAKMVEETAKNFGLEDCLVRDKFIPYQFKSYLEDLNRDCRKLQLGSASETIEGLNDKFRRLRDGFQAIQKVCWIRVEDKNDVQKHLRALEKTLNAAIQHVKDVEKRYSSLCAQCQSIFTVDHLAEDPWYELTLLLDVEVSSCALCRQLRARFIRPDVKESGQTAVRIRYRINLHPHYWTGHYILEFARADAKDDERDFVLSIVALRDATDHNKVVDVPLPVHVDPKTSSKKSLQQANDWLRICRKNHRNCRAVDSEPKKTPKRLIFIDRTSTRIKVRLCETRKLKKKPQYMALSHCWGKTLEARLVRKNYDAYLKEIPQEALPQVFRDTFQLAGQAGINYVWIDSLCIVQDSSNQGDWIREAATMGSVYRHSFCNVAATGFRNGDNGLFVSREPDLLQPIGVELKENVYLNVSHICINGGGEGLLAGRYLLIDKDTWGSGVNRAPLNARGWVVQERKLSVRTLHFGSEQLFWECPELQACEVWPKGIPHDVPAGTSKLYESLEGTTHGRGYVEGVFLGIGDRDVEDELDDINFSDDDDNLDALYDDGYFDLGSFLKERYERLEKMKEREPKFGGDTSTWGMPNRHRVWRGLVRSFSGCNLTFPGDKLIAISGLARILSSVMRCKYHAGMWEDNLIHQLAWKVPGPKPRPPLNGRGPSWSWASVDGAVEMPHWDANPTIDPTILLAHVVDASSEPSDGDEFGFVNGGRTRILGSLGVLRISRPHTTDEEMEAGEDGISIFWDTIEEAQIYGKTKDRRRTKSPRRATPNTVVRKLDMYSSSEKDGGTNDRTKDVFFMPIRMMGEDPDVSYDITLIGLLLSPTGEGKGQFRRIGQFEAYEEQFGKTEVIQMFKRLKTSTASLGEEFFVENDGTGQFVVEIV